MAGPKLFRSRGIMVLPGFGELGPMNSMLDCWFGSQFGAGSRLANVPTGVFEQFKRYRRRTQTVRAWAGAVGPVAGEIKISRTQPVVETRAQTAADAKQAVSLIDDRRCQTRRDVRRGIVLVAHPQVQRQVSASASNRPSRRRSSRCKPSPGSGSVGSSRPASPWCRRRPDRSSPPNTACSRLPRELVSMYARSRDVFLAFWGKRFEISWIGGVWSSGSSQGRRVAHISKRTLCICSAEVAVCRHGDGLKRSSP